MNINFNNIGIGNGAFGIGDQTKVDVQKPESQKTNGLKLSGTPDFQISDLLSGSEPVADVPEAALARDDGLGKLVSAVFNLQAPPMPDFKV